MKDLGEIWGIFEKRSETIKQSTCLKGFLDIILGILLVFSIILPKVSN